MPQAGVKLFYSYNSKKAEVAGMHGVRETVGDGEKEVHGVRLGEFL